MKHLGILKIIIETDEGSLLYAVLLFNEDTREGTLKFYNNGIEITDFDHEGTMQWADKIIALATAKCEEYNGTLWTF